MGGTNDSWIGLVKKIWLSFSVLITFYLITVAFKNAYHGWQTFSVIMSILILIFVYKYLFKKTVLGFDGADFFNEILLPIFIFNVGMVLLSNFNSYEQHLPQGFFHVGFPFGNYTDFYASALWSFNKDGQNFLFSTGYYPLTLAIANLTGYMMGLTTVMQSLTGSRPFFVYLMFFFLALIPLLNLLRNIFYKNNNKTQLLLAVMLLLTSYPVLFTFERGNLSIVTMIFLTLTLLFWDRSKKVALIFVALLVSLKLINVIFIVFLFGRTRKELFYFAFTFATIQIVTLFAFKLFGSGLLINFDTVRLLITNVTGGVVFSNSIKLFATSGVEAFMLAIKHSWFNIVVDGGGDFNSVRKLILLLGGILVATYFIRQLLIVKNNFNITEALIYLILVICLFHPLAADYNLIILLPLMFKYYSGIQTLNEFFIAKLLALILMPLSYFPFLNVVCCGGQEIPGRYVFLTLKSFLLPFIIVVILLTMIRSQKSKNIVL